MTITDPTTVVTAVDFTKVLLIAPRSRIDVALPSDTPISDLMPTLLEMAGERGLDSSGAGAAQGWRLGAVTGEILDASRTLRSADILDGAVLRLTQAAGSTPEPVFDDVVEAIAAAAARHSDSRSLRTLAGATGSCVALLVATAVLMMGPHSAMAAVAVAVVALAALAAGTGLARTGAAPALAVAIAACAIPAATAVGFIALPLGYPAVEVAAALTLGVAVLGVLMVGSGATVFTAATTLAALSLAGAIGGQLAGPISGMSHGASAASVTIINSAVAVGLISMAPWLAVRLARLPVPVIPTTASDLAETVVTVDVADIGGRTAVATDHLHAIVVAGSIMAGVGAVTSFAQGTLLSGLYGMVMVAVLLLRVRSVRSVLPRAALLLSAITVCAVAAIGVTLAEPQWQFAVVAAALLIMVVAVLLTEVAPRHRLSPAAERSIDLIETLLLVSVLPLALGAAQVYSAARFW